VTGCGSLALIQGTVGWDNQPNKEEVDDIENGQTPNNLLGSSWNLLSRISSLGSSESSELSASVGERRCNKNSTEAFKAVEECSFRRVPILRYQLC
jgi:hypothetical protein